VNQYPENRQSIVIQNRVSAGEKLADFLLRYVNSNNIANDDHNDLKLIIEETFTNIISSARERSDYHDITVELKCDGKTIVITFSDTGVAFNPISYNSKNIGNTPPHEGGMGIHIIRSLSDALNYKRVGDRNVFTITKHYTKRQ